VNPGGPILGGTVITVPADPLVATTIGFFLNDWTSRSFTTPAFIDQPISTSASNDGATLKPIALDEWNMFAVNSQQMVSNTSGLFSVLALSEILKNKYGMAARWDLFDGWDNGGL
jgi:hypothetical protein